MATFILAKDVIEGKAIVSVQTMEVPDHLLHKYVNCDWYKSGKWIQVVEQSDTQKPIEPIKREEFINLSNDFISVPIVSDNTAMKLTAKENTLEIEDKNPTELVTAINEIVNNDDMKIKKMKPEEKPIVKKGRPKKS